MSKFQYYELCGEVYMSKWAEGSPMPDSYLKGRPVYFGEMEHGEESFFLSAEYADTGIALTDDELDALTERNAEYLAGEAYQHLVMQAEYACEGDR